MGASLSASRPGWAGAHGFGILLWEDPAQLVEESIANYPQGLNAVLAQSGRAAAMGNADEAMAILLHAKQSGVLDVSELVNNPNFTRLHGRPEYRMLIEEWAGQWIEKLRGYDELNQLQFYSLGMAHAVRGERSQARLAFQTGLVEGGVYDALLRQRLAALRQ